MTRATDERRWQAVANVAKSGPPSYAIIEAHGRTEWKTKRTAEKHAREYKARHLRDAWAEEV